MKKIGFLLDMDGVIYRGDQLIPGTLDFLERLKSLSIPYLFLTNNSQRAQRDVVTANDIPTSWILSESLVGAEA